MLKIFAAYETEIFFNEQNSITIRQTEFGEISEVILTPGQFMIIYGHVKKRGIEHVNFVVQDRDEE